MTLTCCHNYAWPDEWRLNSWFVPAYNIYKLTSMASWVQPWLMASSICLLSLAWIYHQFNVGTLNDSWPNDFNTFAQQKLQSTYSNHKALISSFCLFVCDEELCLVLKTNSYICFRQVDGQLLWGPFFQIHLLLPQVIKFHTVGAGLGLNLNTQHHVDAAERTELMF